MKRRTFLQAIGASGLSPLMPGLSLAPVQAAAMPMVANPTTYKWAETIVRAHNKSSVSMLQRLLKIETQAAEAVHSALLRNGVIAPQANAYGIHTATNPLFEDAFIKPANAPSTPKSDRVATTDLKDPTIAEDEYSLAALLAAVNVEIAGNPDYLILS